MKTTLYIDTTSSEEAVVSLTINGKKHTKQKEYGYNKAQIVLPLIDELLSENGLVLKEIDEIKVHTGPGSFTGLRVGVSVANALSMTLNVQINGKPAGTVVEPEYV